MFDYSHVLANRNDATTLNNTQGSSLSATNGSHPDIFMVRTQLDW